MVCLLFKITTYYSIVIDNSQILFLRNLISENLKIKISCQKIVQITKIASKFPFGSSSLLFLFCRSNKCLVFTLDYFGFNANFWPSFRRGTKFNHIAVSTFQNIQNCIARWNRSSIKKVRCVETGCKTEIRGVETEHCLKYPNKNQKYCILISELANFTEENSGINYMYVNDSTSLECNTRSTQ